MSGMGTWALRRAEAGSGEFPFWTSELLVFSWDSTKGSLFALKTVFFFFLLNKNQTFGINIWIPFSSF